MGGGRPGIVVEIMDHPARIRHVRHLDDTGYLVENLFGGLFAVHILGLEQFFDKLQPDRRSHCSCQIVCSLW